MNEAKARKIKARINRISGQIGGISRMIDEDRHCVNILDQIAAARSAIGVELLTNHIEGCVLGHWCRPTRRCCPSSICRPFLSKPRSLKPTPRACKSAIPFPSRVTPRPENASQASSRSSVRN